MTANTPLEQALVAWNRCNTPDVDRQIQVDDAVLLGETGVFSNRNIAAIVDLPIAFVGKLTNKKDRTGGRFNPEALPQIYQVWVEYVTEHNPNAAMMALILTEGVSSGFLSKLTGIPRTSIKRWVEQYNETEEAS